MCFFKRKVLETKIQQIECVVKLQDFIIVNLNICDFMYKKSQNVILKIL
jgi:hypothetical protein